MCKGRDIARRQNGRVWKWAHNLGIEGKTVLKLLNGERTTFGRPHTTDFGPARRAERVMQFEARYDADAGARYVCQLPLIFNLSLTTRFCTGYSNNRRRAYPILHHENSVRTPRSSEVCFYLDINTFFFTTTNQI